MMNIVLMVIYRKIGINLDFYLYFFLSFLSQDLKWRRPLLKSLCTGIIYIWESIAQSSREAAKLKKNTFLVE